MRYAGFWVRFFADAIDSIILFLGCTLFQWAVLYTVFFLFKLTGHEVHSVKEIFNPMVTQGIGFLIYSLISTAYFVLMHYYDGATVGKKVFKIKVVTHVGHHGLTLNQSFMRCFGYFVSTIPFGAGYIMAAFHPEKRALHDLMAGTVSILEEPTT